MDLRQIRYFVAACEEGSLSAAAKIAEPSHTTGLVQPADQRGMLAAPSIRTTFASRPARSRPPAK